MFIIWVGWLSIGTIYYGCGDLGLGFCKGFYMSVNSGYSIGWGYPYEDLDSEYAFSIYHVIVGASLVGLALGYFGDQAMADQNGWSKLLSHSIFAISVDLAHSTHQYALHLTTHPSSALNI